MNPPTAGDDINPDDIEDVALAEQQGQVEGGVGLSPAQINSAIGDRERFDRRDRSIPVSVRFTLTLKQI